MAAIDAVVWGFGFVVGVLRCRWFVWLAIGWRRDLWTVNLVLL